METDVNVKSQGFTPYQFGQGEVRNDGHENNDTGSDEIAESAVL